MVLSMLATPFIVMYSNAIVRKLVASDWLQQSLQMTSIARKTDQHRAPRDHLRLRPLRPEHGAHPRARRHPLHGARPRSRPRAAGRRGRRLGGVRRRGAAAGADGCGPGARQRGGRDLPRRARRDEGAGQHARPCAAGAGDRAHPGRPRPREAAGRRRGRGGARGHRGFADARQPCAGSGRRADAARDPRGAGPARRALQPAARLLPRRRRRQRRRARPRAPQHLHAHAGARAIGQTLERLSLQGLGVRVASLRRQDGQPACRPRTPCCRTATRWCCRASRPRWRWRSSGCRRAEPVRVQFTSVGLRFSSSSCCWRRTASHCAWPRNSALAHCAAMHWALADEVAVAALRLRIGRRGHRCRRGSRPRVVALPPVPRPQPALLRASPPCARPSAGRPRRAWLRARGIPPRAGAAGAAGAGGASAAAGTGSAGAGAAVAGAPVAERGRHDSRRGRRGGAAPQSPKPATGPPRSSPRPAPAGRPRATCHAPADGRLGCTGLRAFAAARTPGLGGFVGRGFRLRRAPSALPGADHHGPVGIACPAAGPCRRRGRWRPRRRARREWSARAAARASARTRARGTCSDRAWSAGGTGGAGGRRQLRLPQRMQKFAPSRFSAPADGTDQGGPPMAKWGNLDLRKCLLAQGPHGGSSSKRRASGHRDPLERCAMRKAGDSRERHRGSSARFRLRGSTFRQRT